MSKQLALRKSKKGIGCATACSIVVALLNPGLAKAKPLNPPEAKTCVRVASVVVEGVHLVPLKELEGKVSILRNKCLGGSVINESLKAITFSYVERGYIAARAYIPAQDLQKSHKLRIVVVEGQVDGFYENGVEALKKREILQAFPGVMNKPLNMRDLEQGLDQMNALSGVSAKTDLIASKTAGGSFINVTHAPKGDLHLTLSNNNHGSKSTGLSQSTVALEMDDLFHLDEALSLSYQRSGPDYPMSGDFGVGSSDSVSGSLSVPYGYWTGTLHGNWYAYRSKVSGQFSIIETSGKSEGFGGGISRVVHRDQFGKTSLAVNLDYKASTNFLLGNVIETGTRQYSVVSFTASQSRKFGGGLLSLDATYAHGLALFNASPPGSVAVGNADPLFGKLTTDISYMRPFTVGPLVLEYSGTASAQWSPSNLLGSEQISVGGFSTVRGARNAAGYGNNGAFVRNQLDIADFRSRGIVATLGEIRPYVGLDFGHIFGQAALSIADADAASWTVGLHNRGSRFNFDLGYSNFIISNPSAIGNNGVFFASGSLTF